MHILTREFDYFLFDLDDTLYPEFEYLDEAYLNISKFLETKTSIKYNKIYDFLIFNFNNTGRELLFDKMFFHFKIDPNFINDVLTILRTFVPKKKIALYPNIYKKLAEIINNSKQVFVVTNGNIIQQKNKVNNIEWNLLDKRLTFIYANEYEKKPSNLSFIHIKNKYLITNESSIMIGDSLTDKQYATNSGIDFMYIKKFNIM